MQVQSLDKRMTFNMFVKSLGGKLKGLMAKSISPEEKLSLIISEMEKDVQEKRITARTIRAKMVALADPDTAELEPLERLQVRRKKLVDFGAKTLKEKEALEATGNPNALPEIQAKSIQLGKTAQEIKSLDASLSSLTTTYETLKDSYELALENYKVALAALEHTKTNGSSLLFAIKAHQEALSARDAAKNTENNKSDASFLTDLEKELTKSSNELRSDKQLDKELDCGTTESVLPEEDADEAIMNEFRK